MSAASSRNARLFLSYSPKGAPVSERLRPLLKLAGFAPQIDSQALSTEKPWDAAVARAMASSDFVVALLSEDTPTSSQEQELRAAIGDSQLGHGKPLVLACAVNGTRTAGFDLIVPDFLRNSHVLDFADFEIGWRQLYESLYKAAHVAGFWVPKLLRAVPRSDLDRAAVTRMVIEKGFYSRTMNERGGSEAPDLDLSPDELVVHDRSTGRMWTRGCINPSSLPQAPLSSADEVAAEITPLAYLDEKHKVLLEARQSMKREMRLAIERLARQFNTESFGGYNDWRLPTLEEAMSVMSRDIRIGGVYISDLFSDHAYIRTADSTPGPQFLGQDLGRTGSFWIVGYVDADCLAVAEEAPVSLRFVRTDLD